MNGVGQEMHSTVGIQQIVVGGLRGFAFLRQRLSGHVHDEVLQRRALTLPDAVQTRGSRNGSVVGILRRRVPRRHRDAVGAFNGQQQSVSHVGPPVGIRAYGNGVARRE